MIGSIRRQYLVPALPAGACDAVVIRLKAISSTCAMTFLLDGSAFTPRASLLS